MPSSRWLALLLCFQVITKRTIFLPSWKASADMCSGICVEVACNMAIANIVSVDDGVVLRLALFTSWMCMYVDILRARTAQLFPLLLTSLRWRVMVGRSECDSAYPDLRHLSKHCGGRSDWAWSHVWQLYGYERCWFCRGGPLQELNCLAGPKSWIRVVLLDYCRLRSIMWW